MNSLEARFSRLSPAGFGLAWLVGTSIAFGVMFFGLGSSSERRPGAGLFLAACCVVAGGLGYWQRCRQLSGVAQGFFPARSPAVAAMLMFLIIGTYAGGFTYFFSPDRHVLLSAVFWGTCAGVVAYRNRRGLKIAEVRLAAGFFALLTVFVVLEIALLEYSR